MTLSRAIERQATVTLPMSVERGDANTLSRASSTYQVPVVIDPDLPGLGENNGHTIRLREWDEQVLLHEVLHLLVNRAVPNNTYGAFNHDLIREIEVGLTAAGWRLAGLARDDIAAVQRTPEGTARVDGGLTIVESRNRER